MGKMVIRVPCDKCRSIITESAALLFSPPDKDNKCRKWHVCHRCYNLWVATKLGGE